MRKKISPFAPANRTSDTENTSPRGRDCTPTGPEPSICRVTSVYIAVTVYNATLSVFGTPACVRGSVKQEQRECQNSRRRIWVSNNSDWRKQTEKQHHKHMLTNPKDGDVLKTPNGTPRSSHLAASLNEPQKSHLHLLLLILFIWRLSSLLSSSFQASASVCYALP